MTIYYTYTFVNRDGECIQTRRETWITKRFVNGNFKIYGLNTVFGPLKEDPTLARPIGEKARICSPSIVIEL